MDRPNKSIRCSVDSCSHHCGTDNCCTLSEIRIGCSGAVANCCASTECASFDAGQEKNSR